LYTQHKVSLTHNDLSIQRCQSLSLSLRSPLEFFFLLNAVSIASVHAVIFNAYSRALLYSTSTVTAERSRNSCFVMTQGPHHCLFIACHFSTKCLWSKCEVKPPGLSSLLKFFLPGSSVHCMVSVYRHNSGVSATTKNYQCSPLCIYI